jgi:hypothetical protein
MLGNRIQDTGNREQKGTYGEDETGNSIQGMGWWHKEFMEAR